MNWFGESWGAPVNDEEERVAIPVGMKCSGHEHMHEIRSWVIEQDDQGVFLPYVTANGHAEWMAYHLDCWLHEIGADRLPR